MADGEKTAPPSSKAQIKRATRARKIWSLLASLFLFISVIFLILVEIGSTSNKPVIRSTYFINLDLSDIIPSSVPNSALINSIAQTVGLHDFYRVGLWGYCEGYNGEGVVSCSKPQTLYWFNPVSIILNELLAGATISLPTEITDILDLVRVVSHWMFGLFLTGACLNFLMIFVVPLSVFSRWATLPIMIFTFLGALCTTVATVIATVMFIIFRNVTNNAGSDININLNLGNQMFAFMWIATAFSIFAWLIQLGECCCCASRRDVKTGRKRGSKHAYENEAGAS
ncbi:integral membrane protein [Aulographum hederae CBS 113979]|uniref:Integral membrane protein n=1 Tax=Aulographum hederae CBS 113979 TaxID=1176131 RepID=A0A6G1H4J1_9PEZI|nr:integral membrane protein [Aulographum hederae CBS 113979]